MRSAHDVAQVRAAEAALMATLPDGTLMERAAAGLVPTVVDVAGGTYGRRIVLLVGSGDNGGDALLAGALLAARGARVDALLLSSSRHRHVETLLRARGRVHVLGDDVEVDSLPDLSWWQRADVVIDGILGIGGSGGLREPAATVVDLVPAQAVIVAVDLPSGVDPGTGEVNGAAVHADVTVCMGTYKPCLLVDPAAAHAGAVRLVDIGLQPHLPGPVVESLQVDDVLALLPGPGRDDDKYRRGVVGLVAGSTRYPGAAVLSAAGAVRGGAGYVRCIGWSSVVDGVRERLPEVVATSLGEPSDVPLELDLAWARAGIDAAGRVQSYVVGPGLGTDEIAAVIAQAVLDVDAPTVVDADALTLLAERPDLREALLRRTSPTLLTPHAGELARLLGVERSAVEARRLEHVVDAASRFGASVLLKGSTTLVASPEPGAAVRANPTGTSWLGTAGSGDVLSGLLGALLATGLDAHDAGSVGAFVHGLAGQMASLDEVAPLRALELADALPEAVAALRASQG